MKSSIPLLLFKTKIPLNRYGARSSLILGRSVHVEKRLDALGITLPPAPSPKANYNIACHASGNMLYISGHLPFKKDGTLMKGRIGPASNGESIAHGYEAARHAGLNIMSTLQQQLGDLDRVAQVVKVGCFWSIYVPFCEMVLVWLTTCFCSYSPSTLDIWHRSVNE